MFRVKLGMRQRFEDRDDITMRAPVDYNKFVTIYMSVK